MEITKLQEMIDKMGELRDVIDMQTEETKKLNKELTKLKTECVEHLDAHGLRRFDGDSHMVYITEKRSLKIEDKFAFYEWLKDRDIFEQVVTVSSAKLPSIYDEELELAKENGDLGFIKDGIPGLSEPSVFKSITFKALTKGKK